MAGMFDLPVGDDPVNGVIGGRLKGDGPECPECKSRDTTAISRDALWEETTYRCNKCGDTFIKG